MRARVVLLVAILLPAMAVRAGAASPARCAQAETRHGIVAVASEGGLEVVSVRPGSPGSAAGLLPGDLLLQANGELLRRCGDLARAVERAGSTGASLLLLVGRGGAETALVVPRLATSRQGPSGPPSSRGEGSGGREPRESTRPQGPPTVGPLLAEAASGSVGAARRLELGRLVADFRALLSPAHPRPRLAAHRARLRAARRELEGLAAARDGEGPDPVVAGLAVVLRYLDAAEEMWARDESARARAHGSRRYPYPQDIAFFADSAVGKALAEFPFLRSCVRMRPGRGFLGAEVAGRLDAGCARTLLWRNGRAELEALSSWAAAGRAGAGSVMGRERGGGRTR